MLHMQLLQRFSLSEIFVFLILFTLALKGGISTVEWFFDRGRKFFHKTYQKPKELEDTLESLIKVVKNLTKQVNVLVQSDKDDIKAFITRQHHYFCYKVGSIDDQSLDCIEKRFTHYVQEGGNSYIHNLMQELRKLPRDTNISAS